MTDFDPNFIALEINMSNAAKNDPLPLMFVYTGGKGAKLTAVDEDVTTWKEFAAVPLDEQLEMEPGIYSRIPHTEGISFIVKSGADGGYFTDNHGLRFCISTDTIRPI